MRTAPVPPSGWPRAMAPPLGLTLARSTSSSFCPGEHDRGERLVDLGDVDVVHRQAGALHEALGGVDRAGEHEHRVHADEAGVDDAGPRTQTELVGLLGGGEQERRGAVGDLRRRAGGVDAVLAGDRLEGGQLLEGGLAQALVARDGVGRAGGLALLVDVGSVDRHDLAAEAILGPGLGGALLGQEAELVGVVAADAPLVGDALGALELRGELVLREVRLRDRTAEACRSRWSRSAPGSWSRRRRRRRRRPRPRPPGWWRGWWPAARSRTGCRRWSRPPTAEGRRRARRCGRC